MSKTFSGSFRKCVVASGVEQDTPLKGALDAIYRQDLPIYNRSEIVDHSMGNFMRAKAIGGQRGENHCDLNKNAECNCQDIAFVLDFPFLFDSKRAQAYLQDYTWRVPSVYHNQSADSARRLNTRHRKRVPGNKSPRGIRARAHMPKTPGRSFPTLPPGWGQGRSSNCKFMHPLPPPTPPHLSHPSKTFNIVPRRDDENWSFRCWRKFTDTRLVENINYSSIQNRLSIRVYNFAPVPQVVIFKWEKKKKNRVRCYQ